MRALVAGIVHESSSIMVDITGPTVLADFDVHAGDELRREFENTNTVVGGYLRACEKHGVTAVYGMHARAEPGASVDPAVYRALRERLLEAARSAGPVDVVLLDVHGAGALLSGESLDLNLVRSVRELVGPDVPIAVTVDLHANLPAQLPALIQVLVGYLEYPHTDMAERAELAADLAINRQLAPVVRALDLPMVPPPSDTWSGIAAQARDLARAAQSEAGVLACTVLHGYPYTDTPQVSTTVVTVAAGDADLADEVNLRLGRWLWEHRDEFRITTLSPRQAVAQAVAEGTGPVVIGDGTDNPGCGAVGDSTHLLRALLDSGASACFATLFDPASVHRAIAAGVGETVDVELGGQHGWASGPPVSARGVVRAITDGTVIQQAMRRGKTLDFGPSARLTIGRLDVIVSSRRRQVFDPEILILHGAPPDRYDIVAVKSVHHFRAGFAEVSQRILVADAPGPFCRDIVQLPRNGPTAALWPMNPNARWSVVDRTLTDTVGQG